MVRDRSIRGAAGVCLALLAALVLAVGTAGAHGQEGNHDESGLTPSYGDGRLVVAGEGFQPGERVTLSVSSEGAAPAERSVVADALGHFSLDTGLATRPGADVALHARGDRGTVKAAITSVPSAWPWPTRLPRTGDFGFAEWLVVSTVVYALPALVVAGIRRRARPRLVVAGGRRRAD